MRIYIIEKMACEIKIKKGRFPARNLPEALTFLKRDVFAKSCVCFMSVFGLIVFCVGLLRAVWV
jgi:hypothetical protein